MRKSKTALEEAVKENFEFKKLINFNLKTNKIKFTDAVKKFLRILNELKPEYLFVHSEKDANSDHRIISASVTNLSKRVPNILHYKSNFFHTKNLFNPNYFVNISKEFNKKIIAVKKYRGELKRNNNKWIKLIEKNNFLSGDLMGCKYAEAFEVVRLQILMNLSKTFIIAEIGINHDGGFKKQKLILEAKKTELTQLSFSCLRQKICI